MDVDLLGWPDDGPTLRLDHERFSYAGKFVMSNTGKAVARDGDEVVGAIAFNGDRTDSGTLWIRYVTVRADRRGEGIGVSLARRVRVAAAAEGYDAVRIAVNNPYAYQALSRAGFAYTGEETGIAELVLDAPAGAATATPADEPAADPATYRAGLDAFAAREDLSEAERAFVAEKRAEGPPEPATGPVTDERG